MTERDLLGQVGVLLVVIITCQSSIVNYEPGFEYVYNYNSTAELQDVHGFVMRGQV